MTESRGRALLSLSDDRFAAMNLNLLLDGHSTVATTVLKLNKIYFK